MDSSQLPSPSIESTGPMAVVQSLSDQQQSLAVFDGFDLLPTELRVKIWSEALDEEAKTRFLLYHESYGEIGDSIGDRAVFFPHKRLRSSLLEVNRESRWIGLKFYHFELKVYHFELKVYPRTPRFEEPLLDDFDPPESWVAPSHATTTPLGVVHIRPEQDPVFYHSPFNNFSTYPQIGDVECVSANLSAEAREKFQQVWYIVPVQGWRGYGPPASHRDVADRIFKSLASYFQTQFPRNEGIIRFEPQTTESCVSERNDNPFISGKPYSNILSPVMDRILASGLSDIRKHYADRIRVYIRDGREKGEDEHQESPDEDTDS